MNLTLAQLVPFVSTAFAALLMVRVGSGKKMIAIRRPQRCAAFGVDEPDCRCRS